MTLTATAERVREADVTELVMLAYWRTVLRLPLGTYRRGETHEDRAERVVHLMHSATDYEPLLGVPMDQCQAPGCEMWVADTDAARSPDGRLHCSDQCAADDPVSEAGWEFHEAQRGVAPVMDAAYYVGLARRLPEPGGWH